MTRRYSSSSSLTLLLSLLAAVTPATFTVDGAVAGCSGSVPSIADLVNELNLVPMAGTSSLGDGFMAYETFRSPTNINIVRVDDDDSNNNNNEPRPAMTSMYYIVQHQLNFHRVDPLIGSSGETWHYYFGTSVVHLHELVHDDDGTANGYLRTTTLGKNVTNGEVVQYTILPGTWYAAELIAIDSVDHDDDQYALIGNQAGPSYEYTTELEMATTDALVTEFPNVDVEVITKFTTVPTTTSMAQEQQRQSASSPSSPLCKDEDPLPTINELVNLYSLVDHPEGGYFVETYRSNIRVNVPWTNDTRSAMTSIFYIIGSQLGHSDFHRLPHSDETWNYYFGTDPIQLYLLDDTVDGMLQTIVLGTNITAGEVPQYTVPAGVWFGAEVIATAASSDKTSYALAGTNVGPGFEFVDWELGIASDLMEEYPEAKEKILQLTPPADAETEDDPTTPGMNGESEEPAATSPIEPTGSPISAAPTSKLGNENYLMLSTWVIFLFLPL